MNDIVKRFDYTAKNVFRILQLTDLHLITTETPREFAQTLNLIRQTVHATKPDLVAITGDLTWGETMDDRDAMDALATRSAAIRSRPSCWIVRAVCLCSATRRRKATATIS